VKHEGQLKWRRQIQESKQVKKTKPTETEFAIRDAQELIAKLDDLVAKAYRKMTEEEKKDEMLGERIDSIYRRINSIDRELSDVREAVYAIRKAKEDASSAFLLSQEIVWIF
jgi:vacuolar-type H+-ATPase subunit I/STV1